MPQVASSPSAQHKNRLVVFVHGFGSSSNCWEQLLKLLRGDRKIAGTFDLDCFEYDTPLGWQFRFLGRIPDLDEIAEALRREIDRGSWMRYPEITLVGHSQGGLIIQYYLAHTLSDGEGLKLERIRQVILVATPNLGSALLSPVRKVLSYIPGANPQERSLRVLNKDIGKLQKSILRDVVAASYRGTHCYPVPIQAFWGRQDGIVLPLSAQGHFLNTAPLKGSHSGVIRPSSEKDEQYRMLVEALFNPCGHLHVFDADEYKTEIKVGPYERNKPIAAATETEPDREIFSDNRGHVNRYVTFSPKNSCRELFTIRYATQQDGYVTASESASNEALPEYKSAYADTRKEVHFQFRPQSGKQYYLELEIYEGFGRNNRIAHFHLGNNLRIKTYSITLDLSEYLESGHTLEPEPALFFDPNEPPDHSACKRRRYSTPIRCVDRNTDGVWRWELHDLSKGVIHVRWDVKENP